MMLSFRTCAPVLNTSTGHQSCSHNRARLAGEQLPFIVRQAAETAPVPSSGRSCLGGSPGARPADEPSAPSDLSTIAPYSCHYSHDEAAPRSLGPTGGAVAVPR